jgi:hypothetical protein
MNMQTVLVFKTSVTKKNEVKKLSPLLNELAENNCHWNFDLGDCDNILRVETQKLQAATVSALLTVQGFYCEEL